MRVLFSRISWMTWYNGSSEDQPKGQMAFVKERRGKVWERFNFKPIKGRLFGYVAPSGGAPYQFARLDPNADGADHVDGVLLVFMAQRPAALGGGQVVVGWYRNARLYPTWLPGRSDPKFRNRKNWGYCCECAVRDGVLLQTGLRQWKIPHGRGGMGQAKIRYFEPRRGWMKRIVSHIEQYAGPSLVSDPGVEAEDRAALVGEEAQAGGQGFMLDPAVRAAVEARALAVAKRVYRRDGYEVEVVGRPFDLRCYRRSRPTEKLWVEVKGTQGPGADVILTHGEVEFYSTHFPRTELFVLHSVRTEKGVARGGNPRRYRRWRPRDRALRPITYWYRVPVSGNDRGSTQVYSGRTIARR